jgi:excinuclease UvrABC ATPase subunit
VGGGRIIAAGTPEEIAHNEQSSTGRFLASLFTAEQRRPIRSAAG